MASGKAHRNASLALAIPTIIASSLIDQDIATGLLSGLGCVLSVFLTPDLDQEGINTVEWDIVQTLGPFGGIGFLWMGFWHLYAWAIPHRSPWSHLPIFSAAIRLLYLLVPVIVALAFTHKLNMVLGDVVVWRIILSIFRGLCVGDIAHFVMDLRPRRKRRRRSR